MRFISLFSGCGGFDLGLERAGFKCVGQLEIMPYALKVLKKNWPHVPKHTDILTLLRSDSLVKTFHRQTRKAKGFQADGADFSLKLCESSKYLIRNGYLLKMFPDSFPSTTAGTWRSSFKRWPSAAMGGLTEFWTLNISDAPNDAKESSLSDVLEANAPPRYYLSKRAVQGMVARSKKWGKSSYVFLQETDKDETQKLKHLSLQRLEQALTPTKITEPISSPQPFRLQTAIEPTLGQKETLSPKPLGKPQGETLALYGKTLILRKLTPTEKEKLQGFPVDWTLVEESSSETP